MRNYQNALNNIPNYPQNLKLPICPNMKLPSYPPFFEITKLSPKFVKLPNYPCLSTVTGVQATAMGSSGLIVLTTLSPMVVAVRSHARWQLRIELPNPWTYKWPICDNPAVSGDGTGREMMRMSWGTRSKRWRDLNPCTSQFGIACTEFFNSREFIIYLGLNIGISLLQILVSFQYSTFCYWEFTSC